MLGRIIRICLMALCLGPTGLAAKQPLGQVRFGYLTIGDDNNLLFNGIDFNPKIVGNNFLTIERVFRIGTEDVIVVQDTGGTACPTLYYAVIISRSEAKASQSFGTCSDLIKYRVNGRVIVMTMPGFMGPFEPRVSKLRAARKTFVFALRNGYLTENGKLISRIR